MFVLLLHVFSGRSTDPIPKIENLPLATHILPDLLVSKMLQIRVKKLSKHSGICFLLTSYSLQVLESSWNIGGFSQQSKDYRHRGKHGDDFAFIYGLIIPLFCSGWSFPLVFSCPAILTAKLWHYADVGRHLWTLKGNWSLISYLWLPLQGWKWGKQPREKLGQLIKYTGWTQTTT